MAHHGSHDHGAVQHGTAHQGHLSSLHNETAHNLTRAIMHHQLGRNETFMATHTNSTQMNEDVERMSPLSAVLLLYGIMLLMIGAQTALFLWKKKHKKSYELVTLVGLWLMPAIFSIQLHFWRFIAVWSCYSIVTGYLIYQCAQKKLGATTPRLTYTWFLGAYRVSKVVGVLGYAMLVGELLGLGALMRLALPLPKDLAMDLLWYGLYFGVLGRDSAEVASDRMSTVMGTGRKLVTQVNNCGVCGQELKDMSHLGIENHEERAVQLSCKHCFHDLCIRGWTIVGKKDICPVCTEKVDLRALYADRPWETRNLTWIQMLDGVRYLVVWNPIIFMMLSLLFHLFTPHHHGPGHAGGHGLHGPPHGVGLAGLPATHAVQ